MVEKLDKEKKSISHYFKTIFISFSQLAFGEFFSKVFGFFTMVYLARVLGAENFGLVGFVSTISAYVVLFANFGVEQYAARTLAASPLKENEQLIGNVIGSRFILSLLLFIPFIWFGIFYSNTSGEVWLFIFQSLFILACAFNLQFYFVAVKNISTLTLIKTAISSCILLCSYLFVKGPSDLPLVTLVSGTITLLAFLWSVRYVFHKERLHYKAFSFSNIFPLLKGAAPLGVSALMIQIYYSADIVFLGFTNPGVELGYYTGAYRIILLFTLIPGFFYSIFLPELAKITTDHFKNKYTQLYIGLLISFGCILSVVSYIWSAEIINLVLGKTYLPAVGVFKILLMNVFMVFVNVALGNLLIAWNKHNKYLLVVTSGAVANIACNIVLIPQYGIYGAAVSTVVAECAVFVAALYYTHTIFGLVNKEAS